MVPDGPRSDVYHPGQRVSAVERRTRAPDDLDALDLLQCDGLELEERHPQKLHVDFPAVDQDQELVVLVTPAEPGRDAGHERRGDHHVHPRDQAQQIGDVGGAGGLDVLAVYHPDGRGAHADFLFVSRGGVDDVQQVAQIQLVKVVELFDLRSFLGR